MKERINECEERIETLEDKLSEMLQKIKAQQDILDSVAQFLASGK